MKNVGKTEEAGKITTTTEGGSATGVKIGVKIEAMETGDFLQRTEETIESLIHQRNLNLKPLNRQQRTKQKQKLKLKHHE